jgi:hypothetical protein
MQVLENAFVAGCSLGEKSLVIVENENSGVQLTLENTKGVEVETGMEGRIIYNEATSQLVSFEPALVEELV